MSVRSRQRLRTIITVLATALVIAPAAALATHSFTDVDDSDFFHAAVDWMKDNGVTVGCNPPTNTRYCPDDFVTRGEMAVFLERLDSENVFVRPGDDAVDGGNADTVDGMHAADFLGATAKATDADKLDGKNSTDFLAATAKATDADKLDGRDASDFASSFAETTHNGTVAIGAACANYTSITVTAPAAGVIDVRAEVNLRVSHNSGADDDAEIFISDVSDSTCTRDGVMLNSLQVPAEWPTGVMETTLPISDFFEVGAGTHTFWLNGQEHAAPDTDASFWFARIQATFHPMATKS